MTLTNKSTGRLVGASVVFMLVIVPIISYVFLRKGFEYRKESIFQLEEKKIDPDLESYLDTYVPHIGNAQLIHLPGEDLSSELQLLSEIDERIVDRERFDIISFGDELDIEDQIDHVRGPASIQSPYAFILIDTSASVRGVYKYHEDLGKELIRHLSVVIPVPRKRNITLQRDSE